MKIYTRSKLTSIRASEGTVEQQFRSVISLAVSEAGEYDFGYEFKDDGEYDSHDCYFAVYSDIEELSDYTYIGTINIAYDPFKTDNPWTVYDPTNGSIRNYKSVSDVKRAITKIMRLFASSNNRLYR